MVGGPATIGVLMLILLLIGIPVAYVLMIGSSIGLFLLLGPPAASTIATTPFEVSSSFTFTVVPLFILMAEFLGASGITEDIFGAINVWTNKIPGGMAMATTFANGGMAVMSGSSTASAATMAKVAVPEMRKYGYKDTLSAGTVSAAGTFASMLPPSLVLIIYGIITETGIGALFLGGVVPGLMTIVAYIIVIYVWVKVYPEVARDTLLNGTWGEEEEEAEAANEEAAPTAEEDSESPEETDEETETDADFDIDPELTGRGMSFREKLDKTKGIMPGVLLIFIVLGGIYGGFMTPTEAGAIGAFGAFLVGIGYGLRLEGTKEALENSVRTTGMIFLIIVGAVMFSIYLGFTGSVQALISFITDLGLLQWQTLALILMVYLLMGTIMDPMGILVLTLPLTFPLVTNMGYSGVWFGVVIIKTIEMGLVTPPFGLNVYVVTGAIDIDIKDVFKGAVPFLLADLVVLILMVLFPDIVMWLPNTMAS